MLPPNLNFPKTTTPARCEARRWRELLLLKKSPHSRNQSEADTLCVLCVSRQFRVQCSVFPNSSQYEHQRTKTRGNQRPPGAQRQCGAYEEENRGEITWMSNKSVWPSIDHVMSALSLNAYARFEESVDCLRPCNTDPACELHKISQGHDPPRRR